MAEVIRILNSQKESIDKLIPALINKQENFKKLIPENSWLYDDYIKAFNNRDYSTILSWLIVYAAKELEINLN